MANSNFMLVDGVSIPCPSVFTWGLQDISDSESGRTDDGLMHKNRIGQKRKIDLAWNGLTPKDAHTVLYAFDPEYVDVTYWDPLESTVKQTTKRFYVGDRSAPLKIWTTRTKRFESISFSIIEQ